MSIFTLAQGSYPQRLGTALWACLRSNSQREEEVSILFGFGVQCRRNLFIPVLGAVILAHQATDGLAGYALVVVVSAFRFRFCFDQA